MIWRVRCPRISRSVVLLRNTVAFRSHQVWSPFWAQATSEGGMSVKSVVNLWLGHGRKLLQDLIGKSRVTKLFGNIEENAALNHRYRRASSINNQVPPKRYLVERLVRWCSTSTAAEIRRNAVKKLAYGGRNSVPYLGFVGINLISGHGMVTKQDELERLCEDIRCCAVAEKTEQKQSDSLSALSLDDLQIGEPIAKGCNAIVHAASWKNEQSESGENVQIDNQTITADLNPLIPAFGNYDLAVKMMFNYDAESNTFAILRAMHRETIPARSVRGVENITRMNMMAKRPLPPHPNIVTMHCALTDRTPFLPEAMQLYPDALPYRLNANGSGRNMTLFLVMKRYHCNLRDYLKFHTPPPTTRLLLLTQLLEAVNHLASNGIAHRDLKSDNILLDLNAGLDSPVVAISDFGNAYISTNLRMPFSTFDIERGGNYALMAPEVKSANPGIFTSIDYSRSDLWTIGTLAYEIFGQENPFYLPTVCASLQDGYSSDDLPPFPEMPSPIKRLVSDILEQDPQNRPSPAVAANVCHFLLWGPRELISTSKMEKVSKKTLLEWLVTEAAISLLEGSCPSSGVLAMLRNVFLSRLHIREVEAALGYFQ